MYVLEINGVLNDDACRIEEHVINYYTKLLNDGAASGG